MAIIKPDYAYVGTMQGVLNRQKKGERAIVATVRYGVNYAHGVVYSDADPTATQLKNQGYFSTAASQAAADMADPDKKAEWQDVADASNGKWKTARGAAFSSYYAEAKAQG